MDRKNETYGTMDNLLFCKIFQTFRIAIGYRSILIAFLAVIDICLVGWIMDFSETVITTPAYVQPATTELQVYITNPEQVSSFIERNKEAGQRQGVFLTLWRFAAVKFQAAVNSLFAFNITDIVKNIADYFKAIGWAFQFHFVYMIIFSAIKLAVISVVGGSICRIAALQFARNEKCGLVESLRFGVRKFTSFFTAPLVPVVVIVFIGIFLFLIGLIGNIPVIGELLVALSIPLSLIIGALITIIAIGAVAGFNLMFPAVAYDGSDCFDAISRSFSYVYSRPWRMGFYTTMAAVYGSICYVFVRLFAFLILLTSRSFLRLGIWLENSKDVNKLAAIWPVPRFMNFFDTSAFATVRWSESIAAFVVHLAVLMVIGLVVSFIISFYFSANTIIYSLMREKVDNTTADDIYTYFEDDINQLQPILDSQSQTDQPVEKPPEK